MALSKFQAFLNRHRAEARAEPTSTTFAVWVRDHCASEVRGAITTVSELHKGRILRMLRWRERNPIAAPDAFFRGMTVSNKGSHIKAFTLYQKWLASLQPEEAASVEVPEVPDALLPLPAGVGILLELLSQGPKGWSLKHLSLLRWDDVEWGPDFAGAGDPSEPPEKRSFIRLHELRGEAFNALEHLHTWARPSFGEEPLVPTVPGGGTAANMHALSRARIAGRKVLESGK